MKQLIIAATMGLTFATAAAETPLYLNPDADIDARVEDALSRMTLEEKVAMCHAQSKFSSAGCPRLGIPELWMSDGPHGVRAEINWNDWGYSGWTNDSITVFPALTALAATWNPALAGDYGTAVGEEARYRGKDVLLGPGVNIYRTPLNGRNFEYMGEDPYLAGEMCVPYIRNLQKNGVAACVKHYILNDQETWRGSVDVDLSDRALHEIYLPPFRRAILDADSWTIMGSYNKVRGQHACHNDFLLNKLLKGDWGFTGVVITDWGGCHDTRESALNGLDLEMGSYTNGLTSESEFTYDDYYLGRPYREMLASGEVPMSTLDDKVRRLLKLIFRTAMNPAAGYGRGPCDDHYATARRIGDEAVVLLKNDPMDRNTGRLLPIDPNVQSILVVGDNATRKLNEGGGSSELKAKHLVSPLQGLEERFPGKVRYAQGYTAGSPMYGRVDEIPQTVADSLRHQAVDMAREADMVILVGGLNKNHTQDCEGGDRTEYGLPFGQQQLIDEILQVNPRMVLVLLSGNAVELPSVRNIPAIIQGWYLGSMGGESLAAVISGDVNPSGKLPFSFPVKLSDCGAHSFGEICYPGIQEAPGKEHEVYKDDILVGYRWYDTKGIPALFPFGHGLSYTSYEYGKPALSAKTIGADDSVTVEIPVRNTGKMAGKEIVQLYVGDVKCSVPRPVKELKHFAKVDLRPGEETTVTFTVTPDDLKFYDESAGAWTVEPGAFKLYIGASSTDIRHTADITYK